MPTVLTDKQESVKYFFQEFACKILRLKDIYSKSFEDEAFTLCLVYIDRLASGYFGGKSGKNRENFCKVLKELSNDPFLAMIHPSELLQQTKDNCPFATPLMTSIVSRQPYVLSTEDALAKEIGESALTQSEKTMLVGNLWRASMANIAYDYIRNAGIHGPGSGALSFDKTTYEGRTGVKLDFAVFYNALTELFKKIEEISVNNGHFFGNPNYMRVR